MIPPPPAQGEGHFLGIPGLGQVAEDAAVVERVDGGVEVGIAGEENPQGLRIASKSLRQVGAAICKRWSLTSTCIRSVFRRSGRRGLLGEHWPVGRNCMARLRRMRSSSSTKRMRTEMSSRQALRFSSGLLAAGR